MGQASKHSVLVVDNEEGIRWLLKRQLFHAGFSVHLASNGQNALQMLRLGLQVDAIVTDLHTPHLNGLGLLQALRDSRSAVPVMLMTGSADRDLILRASHLGISGFFLKPFKTTELAERLRSTLELAAFRAAS